MSEFDDGIDLSGVEAEPVEKVKSVGEIISVSFAPPSDRGNQSISIVLQYPAGEPVQQTLLGGYGYYNKENMAKGADLSHLDKGQQTSININKSNIARLVAATGVAAPDEMSGKVVGFSYGPRKDDPTRGEFKNFFKPRG